MKNRNTLFTSILLTLACLALSPMARAQLPSPAPDGGYPGLNTAEGDFALFSVEVATGISNTAIGYSALILDTTGSANTALGAGALSNNNGDDNTATGVNALANNTSGSANTANGVNALFVNTDGSNNTATGFNALYSNNGENNTATGAQALYSNESGDANTATGVDALLNNTSGSSNTATGASALLSNQSGNSNTASGTNALWRNITGDFNTATGVAALSRNTGGTDNTATGLSALASNETGSFNTATGSGALSSNTGNNNTALGSFAGSNLTAGSFNIDIGNQGVAGESGTIRIGNVQTRTFVAGISGAGVSGMAVKVNASGQIGTAPSSARFKQNIKIMGDKSDALYALRPVTFRYRPEIDPEGMQQFGLVAEEVEKVDRDLVVRDAGGKPYTVRYEAVNAMLLNEFLKEHREFLKEHRKVEQLEATVAQQQKQIKALASGLQKVSAQIELSKAVPQMAFTNQNQ